MSFLRFIISEYRRVSSLIVDHLFTHGFSDPKYPTKSFNILNNSFYLPNNPPSFFCNQFTDNTFFCNSFLVAITQHTFSVVKAHIEAINLRISKLNHKIQYLTDTNKNPKLLSKLISQRDAILYTKPSTSNLPLRLSHNQIDYQFSNPTIWNHVPDTLKKSHPKIKVSFGKSSFDIFVRLKAILKQEKSFKSSFLNDSDYLSYYKSKKVTVGNTSIFIDKLTKSEFYQHLRFIKLPIRSHTTFNHWVKNGQLSMFCEISEKDLKFCFESIIPYKSDGYIVGADQGFKNTLTLSSGSEDGFEHQTTKINKHSHSLESICEKLARKKKGSKSFKRTQKQRVNFINEQINQIPLEEVKEIRLENIKDLRLDRKQRSQKMIHWSYPLIKDKLKGICEEQGLLFTVVSNSYRSQRCNKCGWVLRGNRDGQGFLCGKCSYAANADMNAARNLSLDLMPLDYKQIRRMREAHNIKGFFWFDNQITFDNMSKGAGDLVNLDLRSIPLTPVRLYNKRNDNNHSPI